MPRTGICTGALATLIRSSFDGLPLNYCENQQMRCQRYLSAPVILPIPVWGAFLFHQLSIRLGHSREVDIVF